MGMKCLVYLGGLHGYPYALGAALTYTPHVIKPVVKEIEVPVKTITYGIKETGCKNSFGFSVPCLAEGEARRKRAADEEAAEAAPTVTVGEPKVTEVEVPQYVYKAVNEKVELAPLCQMDSALLCLVLKLSQSKREIYGN